MKKSFILPILLIVLFGLFGSKLMGSFASNPIMLLLLPVIGFGMLMFTKPKKQGTAASADDALFLLGDFAKDAFTHDEKLQKQFSSAVANYIDGKPMAAANKLEKLRPLCKTDADTYSVCLLLGMIRASKGEYEIAIDLFNKSVILNPTTELAMEIGSAQQRIGELEKARDSYQFALDLDSGNIDARSALATAYVADGMFEEAIDEALLALEINENHASPLATCAICYGVLDDPLLCKHYTDKAVNNGYNADKISSTITALKRNFKR